MDNNLHIVMKAALAPFAPPPAQPEAMHYPKHSAQALGQDYINHVMAMTRERLHEKSDIAIQLAWRDADLRRLHALNQELLKAVKECRNAIQGGQTIASYDSRGHGYEQTFGIAFVEYLNAAIAKVERGAA